MLTAKTGEEHRIHGLELGADDYVTKPFSPREVVLRAQAIPRRSGVADASGPVSFVHGRPTIDAARHAADVDGTPTPVTATGVWLLTAMAGGRGRGYPRAPTSEEAHGGEGV